MNKRYLAIDYGTVRIGLATAWAGFAEPLTVLPNNEQLFPNLAKVVTEQQPEVIVVGLSEKEMAEQSRQFAQRLRAYLEQELGIAPVFAFADETLSSVEVQEKLRQAGHRDLRQGVIDHYAAAQFLQDYLDLHQSAETQ
ncbi:Holliday junction resolvase RuvX [Patescibacteria group bacterium]|nr:Holliday junction resolvase RuvX [Patescibacteria group bacterium]